MTPVAARHPIRLRIVAFTLALLAVGCHSEWRPRLEEPASIKPADAVRIWSGGTVAQWHAVVIKSDSVSGIPYETSLQCDSCRLSMPLVLVDSMKVSHATSAKTVLIVAGAFAAAIVAEALVCQLVGKENCQ